MDPFVASNLTPTLRNKKILLGITGSIAAFKACDTIRYLRQCGAIVRVVLTHGAENFVTKTTLETLSGAPVASDFWGPEAAASLEHGTHHIDRARWADLILVAPASAHFLAKMAHGFADDLLSTEILAFQGPLLVAPAMNPAMYSNPAVQENVDRLRRRGVIILGPTEGLTSCGEQGLGRMLEPAPTIEWVASAFYQKPRGQKVIITLGPTRSPLDPVRFLSNRSSGRMGASLCWAALEAGYQVTAVCGPIHTPIPALLGSSPHAQVNIQTAAEMTEATLSAWKDGDVYLGSAAILDWDFKNPARQKLKKEVDSPKVDFEKNQDLLASLSSIKNKNQFILGFAAETEDPIPNALKKLQHKKCDALFVNDISFENQGFDSDQNAGWWLTPPNCVTPIELSSKAELARKLVMMIDLQRN